MPEAGRTLSREELAWAAGFFDGEGCTYAMKRSDAYTRVALDVGQVNKDTLERFRAAVGGLGSVVGPYSHRARPQSKPIYQYRASSFEDVQAVLAMLWAWLGPHKREQALTAMAKATPYRSVACKRGHVFARDGVMMLKDGRKQCLPCHRDRGRGWAASARGV